MPKMSEISFKQNFDNSSETYLLMARTKKKMTSLTEIFKKYGTTKEKVMMVIGLIAAIGLGAALPLQSIFMGNSITAFVEYGFVTTHKDLPFKPNYDTVRQQKEDNLHAQINIVVIGLCIVGSSVLLFAYLQEAFWMFTGEEQTRRLRLIYLKSLLSQPISFHDTRKPGELITHLISSISLIQEGVSERYPVPLQSVATFVAGFVIGFVHSWTMTLVMLSTTPLLALSMAMYGKIMSQGAAKSQLRYADAGGLAQNVLENMRIVTAYNSQSYFFSKFMDQINTAYKLGFTKSFLTATIIGALMFILFGTYALGFWFGSTQVADGKMAAGDVLTTFFAVLIGAFSIGQIGPAKGDIDTGAGAWDNIRDIVNNVQPVKQGIIIPVEKFKGEIIFDNVCFTYPSRPDTQVLKGFTLSIRQGQKVALVGSSGSGKSTIVSLLLKFYYPDSGTITVDGINLTDIDTKWWRTQIGLVSQEPVLFDTTINENVLLGAVHFDFAKRMELVESNKDKIRSCCTQSLAHDFIMQFPLKYETLVGEKGSLMSGGQRQRIAIARALMKDPMIMLLDEATSALDSTSERVVQQALDEVSKNRTTFIIAHRLSTIKDSNVIVVMNKGFISEIGDYNDLIQKKGDFFALVQAQGLRLATNEKKEVKEPKVNVEVAGEVVTTPLETDALIPKVSVRKWPILRLLRMQSNDFVLMIVGLIAAVVNGAIFPVYTIILSSMLTVFAGTPDEIRSQSIFWVLMFIVLAVVAFISMFGQVACFSVAGERLTVQIRSRLFRSLLDKEIAYFDVQEHSSGILSSRLSEDADKIKALTGQLLGVLVQSTSTIATGLAIGFYHSPELAALISIAVPLVIFMGIMRKKIMEGVTKKLRDEYVKASSIASDAIMNVRIVQSLNREDSFLEYYRDRTNIPHQQALKATMTSSIYFAVSQGAMFFVLAYAFWLASVYIIEEKIKFEDVFGVIFPILFSMTGVGQALAQLGVMSKAAVAANSYFETIDHLQNIDTNNHTGQELVNVQGSALLKNIEFSYPTRPDVMVLKNILVNIEVGKTTALVGSSGSGKSTIIQLLERFYDPNSGLVECEGLDVKKWHLTYLRDQMALVSQDPVLFRGTIYENIAFGAMRVDKQKAEECAKMANIDKFIQGLPDKYDTLVNNTTASGGQKQRIVIARALYKNPKFLLLDEATSALDTESEKIVQEALVGASQNRTTVVIAHRLSTIQDADKIIVMQLGKIIEMGTHDELYRQQGIYTGLVDQQKLTS
eukprot:NODE_220_length_13988_cov_0.426885.p1 type:complete len:1259 gc:universal NODE_220_length_13988_cov_0.426885:8261-12037(+)